MGKLSNVLEPFWGDNGGNGPTWVQYEPFGLKMGEIEQFETLLVHFGVTMKKSATLGAI